MEDVRPRRRKLYIAIAILVLGGAAVAVAMYDVKRTRHDAEDVRKILAVIDEPYQKCTLGDVPPPAELAGREMAATLTGRLTAHKAQLCARSVKEALQPLAGLERVDELSSLFLPVYVSAGPLDVGVCSHVRSVRSRANELGLSVVVPECTHDLPKLAPTVPRDEREKAYAHRVDGELALDMRQVTPKYTEHVLTRTVDGKTWRASSPIRNTFDLYVGGKDDVFTYVFPNEHDDAHWAVLDGDDWHIGMLAGGIHDEFRRTEHGWTLVMRHEEVPAVVQVDAKMEHVTSRTAVPALRDRWGWESDVEHRTMISDAGDVALIRVARTAEGIELASHVIPVGGPAKPPSKLALASGPDTLSVRQCHVDKVGYLVIAGVAALVTKDNGASFAEIPGGNLVDAGQLDCTAQRLYVASARQFTACDQAKCVTQGIAPPSADIALDLEVHGEQPVLFVSLPSNGIAMTLVPRPDTGELALGSAWRWTDYEAAVEPLVLIDGVWFAPSN